LRFFGQQNEYLATARTVEGFEYIQAIHPNAEVGTCRHLERAPEAYYSCFRQYLQWCARWAPRARTVDVEIGSCVLRQVPINIETQTEDTGPLTWLVTLLPRFFPHAGFLAHRDFRFSLEINSRTCAVEPPPN
jgi:hypothetical protein